MEIFKKREVYSNIILICIFISALFILYSSVFLKGEVIVPGDIPYSTPLWQGESPKAEYYKAENYLLSDQINQFYVWKDFARRSISEGRGIPLWNPYIFAGQPLVANAQSALFYPPNIFLYFFSAGVVITIKNFFNILIVGLFGYLYSREINLSRKASYFVSFSLMLSGPVVVWAGHPHSNVFIWFPFILFGIEKILKSLKTLKWVGFTAAGIGLSLLGGHPETSFHLLFISSVYFILRVFTFRKEKNFKVKVILILVALLTGLFVGAVQLLPFSDYLFHSSTLKEGGRGVTGKLSLYSGECMADLTTGITLFYPNFFGNPMDRDYYFPLKEKINYLEQTLYFGLIPLAFFFISLFRKRYPAVLKVLIFISLLSLGISWRLPGFELINHLPLFSLVANGRLKIFFSLSAIVISGFGFDLFLERFGNGEKTGSKNRLILSIPLIAVLIFVIVAFLKSIDLIKRINGISSAPTGAEFRNSLFYSVFSSFNVRTMISLVVALVFIFIILVTMKAGSVGPNVVNLLIIITIIELTVYAWGFNPTIKEKDILPDIDVFMKMKSDYNPFRIIADDKIFLPNYNVIHGIQLMGGYDLPVNREYAMLFYSQGGKNLHDHSWKFNWPLTDLMNVKYYISVSEKNPDISKYRKFYKGKNFTVFKNTHCFPRAFFVYDFSVIPERRTLLRAMLKRKGELRSTVFLEKEPFEKPEKIELKKSGNISTGIVFEKSGYSEVEVTASTPVRGILVISDLFSSGWKVYVDGCERELLKADLALRGVIVPSGTHRITFEYRPLSFTLGKYISVFGILMIILFITLKRSSYRE